MKAEYVIFFVLLGLIVGFLIGDLGAGSTETPPRTRRNRAGTQQRRPAPRKPW